MSDLPDEAVERAARVLAKLVIGTPRPWEQMSEVQRSNLLISARHALAAGLPVLDTAKANEDFAGFYMTNDDGYSALTYYPNEDDDGVYVRSADAGTSLAELIGAARKHAASLRGGQ